MKRAHAGRKSRPPNPRHYLAVRVRRTTAKNHGSRPLHLGEFSSVGNQPGGGWAIFIPPGESIEVQLRIPEGGKPYEAVREWFLMREAAKAKRPRAFDLGKTAELWNLGPGPHISKEACGRLHFSGSRFTTWGPHIQRAIEVWESSGFRGPRPYDLLAYFEPGQSVPILPWHPKPEIPVEDRLLYVAVDLSTPLEAQIEQIQQTCNELRDYALLLAGEKRKRPGRHEIRRDILIFTMHSSAGMTNAQIAKEVFPHEAEASSIRKVKDSLRRLNRAADEYLERTQRNTPPQTK